MYTIEVNFIIQDSLSNEYVSYNYLSCFKESLDSASTHYDTLCKYDYELSDIDCKYADSVEIILLDSELNVLKYKCCYIVYTFNILYNNTEYKFKYSLNKRVGLKLGNLPIMLANYLNWNFESLEKSKNYLMNIHKYYEFPRILQHDFDAWILYGESIFDYDEPNNWRNNEKYRKVYC